MSASASPSSPPSPSRSLVLASLEIGRVLAGRDGATFRARGTCMYPAVRPGDVLRIRSCEICDVAVGDIAVCRRPGYLIGHRVVGTGQSESGPFVVTKPDRAVGYDDGPTYEDDFLGIVTRITRGGAEAPLRPATDGWVAKQCHRLHLALLDTAPAVRDRLLTVAARTQEKRTYRRLAAICFARLGPEIHFVVRVPVNATLGDALFREVEGGEFDPQDRWNGRGCDRFTLVALCDGGKTPAGFIEVTRKSAADWTLGAVVVRRRYAGTGLDDLIRTQAQTILQTAHEPKVPEQV